MIKQFLNKYDPTREYFINALKITLPNLIGALLYLFLRKPFSLIIILVPSFIFLASMFSSTYEDKLKNMCLVAFVIGFGQFMLSILSNHVFVLMCFLFTLSLVSFMSAKYRLSAGLAICWVSVSFALPSGWVNGVNRLIELVLGLSVSVILLLLFDYFSSKYRLRLTLIYMSELITDCFYLFTKGDNDNIIQNLSHKYVFKRVHLKRVDLVVEDILVDKYDIFFHKVSQSAIKASVLIDDEEYYFKKNKVYAAKMAHLYSFYRKIFRAISLLRENQRINPGEKKYSVILTKELIENITLRLITLTEMIKNETLPEKPVADYSLIRAWRKNFDKIKKSNQFLGKTYAIEFYLGIEFILKHLDVLRANLITKLDIKPIQNNENI